MYSNSRSRKKIKQENREKNKNNATIVNKWELKIENRTQYTNN